MQLDRLAQLAGVGVDVAAAAGCRDRGTLSQAQFVLWFVGAPRLLYSTYLAPRGHKHVVA